MKNFRNTWVYGKIHYSNQFKDYIVPLLPLFGGGVFFIFCCIAGL